MGHGIVIIHERVIDSLGRFHGLLRLVIDGNKSLPDADTWINVLPANVMVLAAGEDLLNKNRLIILYKIAGWKGGNDGAKTSV